MAGRGAMRGEDREARSGQRRAQVEAHARAAVDAYGRALRSLRVSVTDRCNLRCSYCMPEEDYVWLPREELLTFEEMRDLVGMFTELGVTEVRLTGGEPLLRRELAVLVQMLSRNPRIKDLALTTNGVLLAEQAQTLRTAGLHRITISLDTLRPERFRALSRRDMHGQVLEGIEAARAAGFGVLKIDTVVMRGRNEDELGELLEFGKSAGAEVRFIEYMDVGGATQWSMSEVFSRQEIIGSLSQRYGRIAPLIEDSAAPAQRYLLPDGTVFGIIASTTTPFCRSCDRSRLTADGVWYLCLYAPEGKDLRRLLRGGASQEEIRGTIATTWQGRTDRGAEERKAIGHRSPLLLIEQLKKDPHLEMHTRGG